MLPPSRGVSGLSAGNAGTLGSSRLADPGRTLAWCRSISLGSSSIATQSGIGVGRVIGAGSVDIGTGENCTRGRLSGLTRSSSTGLGVTSDVGHPPGCVE